MVALSVAATLAVFLLYTSIAGGTTASLRPSQLSAHANEKVQLAGLVIGPVAGDPYEGGMRFRLRDIDGKATVRVVYTGSKPDLFRPGPPRVPQGAAPAGHVRRRARTRS